MQIKISARHGHLSDANQEKVRGKLDRLLRLFDRVTSIEATIDLQAKESVAVEVLVNTEHKHDFVANETADELFAALDGAVHKVEMQLRKYKEKIQEHHRGAGHKQQGASPEA